MNREPLIWIFSVEFNICLICPFGFLDFIIVKEIRFSNEFIWIHHSVMKDPDKSQNEQLHSNIDYNAIKRSKFI